MIIWNHEILAWNSFNLYPYVQIVTMLQAYPLSFTADCFQLVLGSRISSLLGLNLAFLHVKSDDFIMSFFSPTISRTDLPSRWRLAKFCSLFFIFLLLIGHRVEKPNFRVYGRQFPMTEKDRAPLGWKGRIDGIFFCTINSVSFPQLKLLQGFELDLRRYRGEVSAFRTLAYIFTKKVWLELNASRFILK